MAHSKLGKLELRIMEASRGIRERKCAEPLLTNTDTRVCEAGLCAKVKIAMLRSAIATVGANRPRHFKSHTPSVKTPGGYHLCVAAKKYRT